MNSLSTFNQNKHPDLKIEHNATFFLSKLNKNFSSIASEFLIEVIASQLFIITLKTQYIDRYICLHIFYSVYHNWLFFFVPPTSFFCQKKYSYIIKNTSADLICLSNNDRGVRSLTIGNLTYIRSIYINAYKNRNDSVINHNSFI